MSFRSGRGRKEKNEAIVIDCRPPQVDCEWRPEDSLIRQHANSTIHGAQVAAGHASRWLIVDADLEGRRRPFDEADRFFAFDVADGVIDFRWLHISAVEHHAADVFASPRIAFHELCVWVEAGLGDLLRREVRQGALVGWHQRRVSAEREVNARVGHEVRLELRHVDVDGPREAQRRSTARHDLGDDAIEIRVRRVLHLQIRSANVVNRFVVEEDGTVGVIHAVMRRQHRVVRLDDNWRDSAMGRKEIGAMGRSRRHELFTLAMGKSRTRVGMSFRTHPQSFPVSAFQIRFPCHRQWSGSQ